MAYTDKSYFELMLKGADLDVLLDDENGQEVDGRLEKAIANADDLIDGYLKGGGVTLPLNPVPESVKRCSYAIALYYLHDWIQPDDIPGKISEGYDKAIEYLKGISSGAVTLNSTAQSESEESGVWSSSESAKFHRRMF